MTVHRHQLAELVANTTQDLNMETAANTSQIPATAIVVTEKCFIRPYEESDAEALAAAANHPDISHYMRNRFPYPYTLDDAKFFVNLANERKPRVNFAICLPDGTYAGGIGLIPG